MHTFERDGNGSVRPESFVSTSSLNRLIQRQPLPAAALGWHALKTVEGGHGPRTGLTPWLPGVMPAPLDRCLTVEADPRYIL